MAISIYDVIYIIAAVMVIEGVMPFVHPSGWRKMLLLVLKQTDSTIRVMGLSSMLVGLGLLYVIR